MHCPSSSSPWTRPVHLSKTLARLLTVECFYLENHFLSLTLESLHKYRLIKFLPLCREASWATGHLGLAPQGLKGEQSQWTVTHCGCAGREDGYLTGERASNTSRIPSTAWLLRQQNGMWPAQDTQLVSHSVQRFIYYKVTLLLFSRLIYGNFPDYPANSCLDIRDHRSSTPPSGAYYINITDPCTEESNITKVETQYMIQLCLELNTLHTWQVQ